MANRDIFPNPQVRLQSRGIATGDGSRIRGLSDPLSDRGVAYDVPANAWQGVRRDTLRHGAGAGRVASGLRGDERADAFVAAAAGRPLGWADVRESIAVDDDGTLFNDIALIVHRNNQSFLNKQFHEG